MISAATQIYPKRMEIDDFHSFIATQSNHQAVRAPKACTPDAPITTQPKGCVQGP